MTSPIELNNNTPVDITVSGNMQDITLITTKETDINITGNMIGCGFSGENLHSSDITSITVGGEIFNASPYSFVYLNQAIPALSSQDLPLNSPSGPSAWYEIFNVALNPQIIANLTIPQNLPPSEWASYAIGQAALFGNQALQATTAANPGFTYNPATGRLGFAGPMSSSVLADLDQPITVLRFANGLPILDASGHFVTDTVSWAPPSAIQALYQESQGAPSPLVGQLGYRIGGLGNSMLLPTLFHWVILMAYSHVEWKILRAVSAVTRISPPIHQKAPR